MANLRRDPQPVEHFFLLWKLRWPMSMHRNICKTSALLSLVVLSACVSVDSRAFKEVPAPGSNGNLRGAYWNVAFYRSKGELLGHETIAEAMHIPAAKADTAYIWRVSQELLVVRFTKDGVVVAERKYKFNEGFKVDNSGRIEIGNPTECGGHDSPGFGCGWGTVTIFENAAGELAAVQSGGGAGLLGVIPFAIYAKHLSLFAHRADAPPFDGS